MTTPQTSLQNHNTFEVHSKIPTGTCQGRALPRLAVFLTNMLIQISPVNQWVVLSTKHKTPHFFPLSSDPQNPSLSKILNH